MFYSLADIFFVVFHTGIILFNLFGWGWKKTRKWNLALLLLTGLSWSVLGIWYGFGYCPFTDWHFDVLRELGHTGLPNSYIEYLIERLLPVDVAGSVVNTLTLTCFLLLLLISGWLNWRDWGRGKKQKATKQVQA